MVIKTEHDVTPAVLSEIARADDPRLRELLTLAVRHMHAFVREARPTEAEFHKACGIIARLGQLTTASHNEVVLMAGSLGVSQLVCLLNNGDGGQEPTTANMMGPFWRMDAPAMPSGSSIVRGPTPGDPLFVDAWVKDSRGNPVAGAMFDVWQASAEGYYESQDPEQAEMNLRGTFTTDAEGHVAFRSVKPAGYPIPANGPAGDLFRALHRHNMRPAHIHVLIYKPGFKTQFSQIYSSDDPNLETDAQFGVTEALVADYVPHEGPPAPDPDVTGRWYSLARTFVIEPGEARLPKPPITGKAEGPRPQIEVLEREP